MDKALVIGHCWANIKSGRGHDRWPPAPTSLLFERYDFDGVKITCHHFHNDSDYYVEANPSYGAGCYEKTGRMIYGQGAVMELPYNTGLLALWFALDQGFDPIYTIGIDMVDVYTGTGCWDEDKVKGYLSGDINGCEIYPYVRLYKPKPPWKSQIARLHTRIKRNKYFIENREKEILKDIDGLLDEYPDQKVYKTHKLSLLPVEVKQWN